MRKGHTQVAPGIYAVDNEHVDGKSGIVVGTAHVLVFDAGRDQEEGLLIRDLAQSMSDLPIVLTYSHGHWDHARGGAAFEGAHVVCHSAASAQVKTELEGSHHGLPNETFDQATRSFDLGGVHVELLEAPGHAPGSVVLWCPESRVLFAGDTVVTSIPPVFRDGDATELEATLGVVAAMGIETLVPGHGDVVNGRTAVADRLRWNMNYLGGVRKSVEASLSAGRSEHEIVDAIADYELAIEAFPADRDRAIERHRNLYVDMARDVLRHARS